MPWQTHQYGTLLAILIIRPVSILAQQAPPPGSPYNYNPPMATVLIILIVVFFTVGFISVYIRHFALCLGIGFSTDRGGGGDYGLGGRRERLRGLDPAIVNSFPTFIYSHVKMHRIGQSKTSLECAICLNEFEDHEVLRLLPRCSHVFHPHCIGPWLAAHVTCPVCRANLEVEVYDVDSLAQQLEQPSEDESETSDQIIDDHPNSRDVIVPIRSSPVNVAKSPVQETKGVGARMGKLFLPRSHSTGHSLVEDCERYTLRLPEEVRTKLVNVNLSGLPSALVSPRIGYRARSVGCTGNGIKPDRWRFSVSPPFISRPGSAWSPKSEGATEGSNRNNNNNNSNNSTGFMSGPRSLFKSIKSPLNRVTRTDDIGERSSHRLWPNRSHELELEGQ